MLKQNPFVTIFYADFVMQLNFLMRTINPAAATIAIFA